LYTENKRVVSDPPATELGYGCRTGIRPNGPNEYPKETR